MIFFQGGRRSYGGKPTGLARYFDKPLALLEREDAVAGERVLHWGSQGFPQAVVESPRRRQLMARWMETTAGEVGIKEPAYCFGASLAPGETLRREAWEDVAWRLLARIEANEHLAAWAVRVAKGSEGIHLVVNRVSLRTGQALRTGALIWPLHREVRKIEADYGLKRSRKPRRPAVAARPARAERRASLASSPRDSRAS